MRLNAGAQPGRGDRTCEGTHAYAEGRVEGRELDVGRVAVEAKRQLYGDAGGGQSVSLQRHSNWLHIVCELLAALSKFGGRHKSNRQPSLVDTAVWLCRRRGGAGMRQSHPLDLRPSRTITVSTCVWDDTGRATLRTR